MDAGRFDELWGIERDPSSDAFGEVVVPVILLWSRPGGTAVDEGAKLTGALEHGETVRVIEEREIDGLNWYRVEGSVVHENEIYVQEGWLRDTLLRDIGERVYE